MVMQLLATVRLPKVWDKMISKIKIEDNYLPNESLCLIFDVVSGEEFPWFYQEFPERSDNKDVLLTHLFYHQQMPNSEGMKLLEPLVDKIKPNALIRIKANSFPNTSVIKTHKRHTDYKFKCTTSLFYLNTNNGVTKFEDGTIVESVANRLLTFDTRMPHCSTSCTDERVRYNININYFGEHDIW